MDKPDFEQIVLNGAQENFLQRGEVAPMLLGVMNGRLGVVPMGPLMKDKNMVGAVIAQLRAMVPMMAFVTEAWTAKYQSEADMKVAPADREDREEVVLVNFYFEAETKVMMAKIFRPVGCSPHLGDWEDRLAGSKVEGRFFQPPPSWN